MNCEQELRADTANLFTRLAIVEDLARVCKVLAGLGRPDAPAACARAGRFGDAIEVEPEHAFPRAFLAQAWTDVGEAYERLAAGAAAGATDLRSYRVAALERHRRSREIWSDLSARGLVSPVDTGRVSAASRAVERAERVAVAADR